MSDRIQWARAQAERSREAADKTAGSEVKEEVESESDRHLSSPKEDKPATREETLLAAILACNEKLLDALRSYDDLERVGMKRNAEERCKREVGDRSVSLHLVPLWKGRV